MNWLSYEIQLKTKITIKIHTETIQIQQNDLRRFKLVQQPYLLELIEADILPMLRPEAIVHRRLRITELIVLMMVMIITVPLR